MSDSDENSGTNVFMFKKKSFQKRKPVDDDDDDDSDSEDEVRFPMTKTKVVSLDIENDESDSDIEVLPIAKPTVKKNALVEALVDSSDDDDDDNAPDYFSHGILPTKRLKNGGISKELASIRAARLARERLTRAQQYHAEDVPDDDDDDYADGNSSQVMDLLLDLPSMTQYGAKLTVSVEIHGARYSGQTIRKLEPLQKVVNRWKEAYKITESSCSLLLEGTELDLTKTPASCGISGNECFVLKPIAEEKKKKQSLGQQLTLKLRTLKGTTLVSEDDFQLRSREPFAKLVELYRTTKKVAKSKKVILKFEGDVLDAGHFPTTHDMECDDIIEVTVR